MTVNLPVRGVSVVDIKSTVVASFIVRKVFSLYPSKNAMLVTKDYISRFSRGTFNLNFL